MTGLTYDTAVLVAAERGDRRVWLVHRRALERGVTPTVPAAVLAEGWRGGARLARFLAGAEVEPLDPQRARAAGLLLGRCSRDVGAVDATVAESALRRHATVVTGNRADVQALADGVGRRLAFIDV